MFNYRNQRLDITELEIDFYFITNIQGTYVEPYIVSFFRVRLQPCMNRKWLVGLAQYSAK